MLVGYSSQLHALANIPIRMNIPRLLLRIARVLAVVLVMQAAVLTALAGGSSSSSSSSSSSCPSSVDVNRQGWGSAARLACYLLMLLPPRIFKATLEDNVLATQPIVARRMPSIVFSGWNSHLHCLPTIFSPGECEEVGLG